MNEEHARGSDPSQGERHGEPFRQPSEMKRRDVADEALSTPGAMPAKTGVLSESALSRRKLLASMGVAGASFAAGGLLQAHGLIPDPEGSASVSVYGPENHGGNAKGIRNVAEQVVGEKVPPMIQELVPPVITTMLDESCLQTISIADMRAMAAFPTVDLYFVTDAGKEGCFRYDSLDTATTDNTGTVIVAASGARFKRIHEGRGVNVKWFGAFGDGLTDDTAAIQAAMDAMPDGGIVFFPDGTYRTTSKLIVKTRNVMLTGTGKRNIQHLHREGEHRFDHTVPSTVLADHAGDCVWLSHAYNVNGFSATRLTFVTNVKKASGVQSLKADRCFGFDLGGEGQFRREFVFEHISVGKFGKAFELYASSPSSGTSFDTMGVLRIQNCATMHNDFIVRTADNTAWNGFVYDYNEGGNNGKSAGTGGIHISGHSVSICRNVLEGQRDTIRITGGQRGLTIKNNYFEANTGEAVIYVHRNNGPFDIGENCIMRAQSTHRVVISQSLNGRCSDPYWPQQTNKLEFAMPGINNTEKLLNNQATTPYFRSDRFDPQLLQKPAWSHAAPAKPPVEGTVAIRRITEQFAISAAAGEWVVVCWMLRQKTVGRTPFTAITLQASGQQYEFEHYGHGNLFRNTEFAVITAAIKASSAASGVTVDLWPCGKSPASGESYEIYSPLVYTIADVNDIRPYVDMRQFVEHFVLPDLNGLI